MNMATGMADPFPKQRTLTLELRRNDDEVINCIFCQAPQPLWVATVKYPGTVIGIGICQNCCERNDARIKT